MQASTRLAAAMKSPVHLPQQLQGQVAICGAPTCVNTAAGGMNAACSRNSSQLMLLLCRMQAAADARARLAADARRQAVLQREAARKEARAREEADAMEHLRAFKESIKGAASRVSPCKRL